MTMARSRGARALGAVGLSGALLAGFLINANASSHREAPLLTEDPVADATDTYAFSTPGDTVTLVGNWIPFEEPAGGPNFHRFGDDVLYEFEIDNDGDAVQDIEYEWRFRTDIKNPDSFLYNLGPISPLMEDGKLVGYENLNIVQTYTVTRV
jgi:Domain of unknown function (DUF4331)